MGCQSTCPTPPSGRAWLAVPLPVEPIRFANSFVHAPRAPPIVFWTAQASDIPAAGWPHSTMGAVSFGGPRGGLWGPVGFVL
eukprot:4935975-Pyramimonas_sp.AAC.1